MSKLIFCATPARLNGKKKEIMDFVTSQGYGPFHPFQALEFERFEGGPIGREKTMEFCKRMIDACDEFWVFGISDGTLRELVYVMEQNGMPIKLFLDKFDPDWKKYYKQLGPKYGNPLDKLSKSAKNQQGQNKYQNA